MTILQGLHGALRLWKVRHAEKMRARGEQQQWFLLAGLCDVSGLLAPQPERLLPIYPPDDRFWADPFVWRRDGRYFIFFEEYHYSSRRGHISVMEANNKGCPVGTVRPVIQEPYHLSYPFLFEYDNELYMLPEKKEKRCVDLYRCIAFPDRWEPIRRWFSDTRMVDCTVFEHEGYWWLFCSVKRDGLRYDESLLAYYTDNPLSGEWVPHPGNPLVRDFSRGRSAGRVQYIGQGRLLRPSQDCTRHYGNGLNINEITRLTPTHYQERLLWHKTGEEAGGWRGMHHIDWHQGLMVMDALRILDKY